MERCELNSSASVSGKVAGCCEKADFFYYLNHYQLFNKGM
jgi:hypothetical protein